MKDKFAVSMFGQKRLSREGGIEIVVKELCTRMAQDGCQVTCYNRSGHHVSGAEYDNKIEYIANIGAKNVFYNKILERNIEHYFISCEYMCISNNGIYFIFNCFL